MDASAAHSSGQDDLEHGEHHQERRGQFPELDRAFLDRSRTELAVPAMTRAYRRVSVTYAQRNRSHRSRPWP